MTSQGIFWEFRGWIPTPDGVGSFVFGGERNRSRDTHVRRPFKIKMFHTLTSCLDDVTFECDIDQ